MSKLIRCKRARSSVDPDQDTILGVPIHEKDCPLRLGHVKENADCRRCSFNTQKKKTTRPSKTKPVNQEPWGVETVALVALPKEAVALPKNPFTEKQYRNMKRVMKPNKGFDLRSRVKEAAIDYLTLRRQFEGKPRLAKIKRDLEKVRKSAKNLHDLLHETRNTKKVDDDTLALLGGDIWQKICNCEDDVYMIYVRALAQLKTFPPDPGGVGPWLTDIPREYVKNIAAIYENGTGTSIKRGFYRDTEEPTPKYKGFLNFFRLCWESVNPEDKNLSDNRLDGMYKNYVLKPTK